MFFSILGIRTVVSRNLKQPVALGKTLAKAEFCAPVMALHGHVVHLLKKLRTCFYRFILKKKQIKKVSAGNIAITLSLLLRCWPAWTAAKKTG